MSAQKFFNKAMVNNSRPRIKNIEKSGSDTEGIRTWYKRRPSVNKIRTRRVKCLNNIVEQDHRNIKRRIVNCSEFEEFESAQRTLSGIEVVSIIKKIQISHSRNTTFKTLSPTIESI